jgi:hypothetical protein
LKEALAIKRKAARIKMIVMTEAIDVSGKRQCKAALCDEFDTIDFRILILYTLSNIATYNGFVLVEL